MQLQPQFLSILDSVKGAWRFRRTALLVAWGIALIGWLAVCSMPNVYAARTRVYVDTATALRPLLEGIAFDAGIRTQLDLVRSALLSRPQLEKVALETGLLATGASSQQRDQVIDQLRQKITLGKEGAQGDDQLYMMSYQDTNRDRSVRVVSTLLDTFVSDVLGGKRSGQEEALQFLRQQIQTYERRLSEAEIRLADFKKRHVGLVPGTRGDYFARLQAEDASLEQARAQLRIAESRRAELETQLRGETRFGAGSEGSNSSTIGASGETALRLQQAEAKLDELLLRFTEKHPEVIATQEVIEDLRARKEREIEAMRNGLGAVASGSLNPVYQRVQMSLNETSVEIAALRSEIADRARKMGEYRKLLDQAAEVEAELSRLNRDYGITKSQYESLVDRLDKAVLGSKADETGVIKFEIIEPPTAKTEPVAPNRPIMLTAALLLAVLGAAAVAYALNLVRPVFQSSLALAETAGVPVLGSVSVAAPRRWRAAQRLEIGRLGIAAAMLVIAYVGILTTGEYMVHWVNALRGGS